MGHVTPAVATALLAAGLMLCWFGKTNSILPEPYLDEVFHVRQTQAYWAHRWRQWDPKITTPPGLYLVSYALASVSFKLLGEPVDLSASVLRAINGLVVFNALQFTLRRFFNSRQEALSVKGDLRTNPWDLNLSILNICLFPPIFFFSGLYYTDLASLVVVLEAYNIYLARRCSRNSSRMGYLQVLISGLVTLLFRQTNIFWVAVFLGGLEAVDILHSRSTRCNSSDMWRIARSSWEMNQLYDPPASEACLEDYLKVGISLAISVVANLPAILLGVLPYVVILGCFGLFVVINGSVVLGHKEFHSAGLHLPQMLYIWPYFMFFSWPVILHPWAMDAWSHFKHRNTGQLLRKLPRPGVLIAFLAVMAAIVHLNTIVHPFTLADNRHYVFYVFRLLLRHPIIKYAVTPVYILCGWATIAAFGTRSLDRASKSDASLRTKQGKSLAADESSTKTSFVLIWLIATSLSLITAPLVEPRYFIIPWVVWRLHITPLTRKSKEAASCLALLTETGWYLLVNFVTAYVFLYRGFEWPQEPGKIQRFMW